jgi:CDP-glucose 4,6-dehydratase
VCVTRCGNFYGGGDLNWNRIVPGTIRSVLRGEPPVIRSDGHYVRDYLYVEDGVRAYVTLAEQLAARPSLAGEVFNFSYEHRITVLELVARILEVMQSGIQPEVRNEATNEIRHQYLDSTKAKTQLGWTPAFTFDESLKATVDWYRRYFAEHDTAAEAARG